MSLLSANHVTVRRGGRAILRDVSASFASGTFVAVIGANGAGKSTLLSVLAGLLKPDGGEARLDGSPVMEIGLKALARRRAYLPQNPRCDWPISTERLVALGLTPSLPPFGALEADVQDRVDRAILSCDLGQQRDQAATTLSGGELARAMLARALVGEPDILIVDEPIAGLDPRHALDTVARLRSLAAGGTLVIAALHDLTLAARYASHVLALREGGVAAEGPMAQTLTSDLLRAIFDVEACISGQGATTVIDYVASASRAG